MNYAKLTIQNLTVARNGRPIIFDLSFSVNSGEMLLILGPNGVGKSTLLRAIAGFLPLYSGSVNFSDLKQHDEITSCCHYIGHKDGLKYALTVRENLEFYHNFLGCTRKSDLKNSGQLKTKALTPKNSTSSSENTDFLKNQIPQSSKKTKLDCQEALRRLHIEHLIDFPASYLSAGQKRRVALARLLINKRPLWLLDEPINALDTASQTVFFDLMAEHLNENGSILAATHVEIPIKKCQSLLLQPVEQPHVSIHDMEKFNEDIW